MKEEAAEMQIAKIAISAKIAIIRKPGF